MFPWLQSLTNSRAAGLHSDLTLPNPGLSLTFDLLEQVHKPFQTCPVTRACSCVLRQESSTTPISSELCISQRNLLFPVSRSHWRGRTEDHPVVHRGSAQGGMFEASSLRSCTLACGLQQLLRKDLETLQSGTTRGILRENGLIVFLITQKVESET